MNKVLISTSSFGVHDAKPLNLLSEAGMEYILNPHKKKMTTCELSELLGDIEYLIAGTEAITEEIFAKHTRLKIISRCGSGVDAIDLHAARKHNVTIETTPEAPVASVAELTMGLILDVLRGISKSDRNIRSGNWSKPMGSLLEGRKVGIVGFGRIGRHVAKLLSGFDVSLAVHDAASVSLPDGLVNLPLEKLLEVSDVVSLHLPYSLENKYIIGQEQLALMKQGSILINASRGGLVDEHALKEALTQHLAGAGLDVFEQEPYNGPLIQMDNVVLTSHIGSYTKEARVKMELQAVENILKHLKSDHD